MQLVCPSCLTANRVPPARLVDHPVCGKCRVPLLPAQPIALTDASFGPYVGGSDMPVLVDFWADWCAPCRMMAPILDDVARRRSDLRIAKVDTTTEQATAAHFQVRSIPTLVLMRRGAELARMSGALPATQLLSWVDEALRNAPKEMQP